MLIDAPEPERVAVAVVPMGEAAEAAAIKVIAGLRRSGIAADMAYKGNMKRRMQKADAWGARFAIILGEDELARGEAAVKELSTGAQTSVALDRLSETLAGR
jgi:histidyl-tRNA synthetase